MISHIAFASIPAVDLDRAIAFWTDRVGLTLWGDQTMPEMGLRWVMLEIPGAPTRLHLEQVSAMPETRAPALPIVCRDVEFTVSGLKEKGVEVVQEPGPAEWDAEVTRAMFRDSEGNLILLVSP